MASIPEEIDKLIAPFLGRIVKRENKRRKANKKKPLTKAELKKLKKSYFTLIQKRRLAAMKRRIFRATYRPIAPSFGFNRGFSSRSRSYSRSPRRFY